MGSDHQNPNNSAQNMPSSSNPRATGEDGRVSSGYSGGEKPHFPNPPDPTIPDPATLREQWKYATRLYSKWYAHAWGTAIVAGVSFFALGWFIKGSNPLNSFKKTEEERSTPSPDGDGAHPSR